MKAICSLCFHRCALEEGQTGLCRARGCRDGRVVSLNYGQVASLALDPIEKKPLRRFHPGSFVLSAGSFGCNLRCPFCQNASISMAGAGTLPCLTLSPAALAEQAAALRPQGNIGVAIPITSPWWATSSSGTPPRRCGKGAWSTCW